MATDYHANDDITMPGTKLLVLLIINIKFENKILPKYATWLDKFIYHIVFSLSKGIRIGWSVQRVKSCRAD